MIKLYIAMSVDGFIADEQGGVAWLEAAAAPDTDYGYGDFLNSVDSLIMGRRTYDQVLGFGPWPYTSKQTFIITHQPPAENPHNATFLGGDIRDVVRTIEQTGSGDTWLVGGGELIAEFRRYQLIDEYHLAMPPILLGAGIPLFPGNLPREDLELLDSRSFPGGFVSMIYRRS